MMPLTFDESTHSYWRDGQRVLSVTQILTRCGLTSPHWNDAARERGVRVHHALHMLQHVPEHEARECLQASDLPFFAAGLTALQTFGIEVLGAEELVDGGTYAGRLDLRCRLRGRDVPYIVDFKSGRAPRYAPLQLMAYAQPQPVHHERAIIELLPSGRPKLTLFRNPRDLHVWRCCLEVVTQQLTLENADAR